MRRTQGRVDPEHGAMVRALALAERGRATVRPNPMVGCVVLAGAERVGEGWHERAGDRHAEVAALEAAAGRARGATVVVTLEPCTHHGRTAPCTDALVAAGVSRVVYAVDDPDPRACGGAAVLRAAGIETVGGLLAPWAAEQNEVFLHVQRTGRPFVTLKLAQTATGDLVADQGRWITGPVARAAVHRLRARVDGVVVGSGTVLADDPALTVRDAPAVNGQPAAVVLDGSGRTPMDAAVVREGTVVVTAPSSDPAWRQRLAGRGVDVVVVDRGPAGTGVDLPGALVALHRRGLDALLLEGGAEVAASFVSAGLVDRLVLHVAPPADDATMPAAVRPAGRTAGWVVERCSPLGHDRAMLLRPRRR